MVYPGSSFDGHANDVMGAHAKHHFAGEDGIIIALTDPWVMWPQVVRRLPLAAWTPVDHDPLMQQTASWFRDSEALPIAMSKFGERVMREADLDPIYVPHAFDAGTFYPRPKDECRKLANMPDGAFVVGIVAANKGVPSRKGFAQSLAAYKAFSERHPKETCLYMHTQMRSPEGENLVAMCERMRIQPRIVHQYYYTLGIAAESLANVMGSFDVLMNLAHGEGFGVPILETMACGVPAIVTNFSSMPEVVGNTGWLVGGQQEGTPFESFQLCPDIEEAVEALESAFSEPAADREARVKRVLEHADTYEANRVREEHWRPAMREIEQRLDWASGMRQIKAVR